MELLVSGFGRGAGVYRFNSKTGKFRRILRGHTHGMCWTPAGFFARVRAQSGVVDEFTGDGEHLASYELWNPDGDYHDLKYFDQRFYAVSSQASWVEVYDADWKFLDVIPITESASLSRDTCHLNSILPERHGILATVFGMTEEEEGWRGEENRNKGALLDLTRNEVRFEGLSYPHSLTRVDGKVVFCDSGNSSVVVLTDTNWEKHCFETGFLRGIAPTETGVYIGSSVPRTAGGNCSATLAKLDKSFNVVAQWAAPCQEIYEILEIEED